MYHVSMIAQVQSGGVTATLIDTANKGKRHRCSAAGLELDAAALRAFVLPHALAAPADREL